MRRSNLALVLRHLQDQGPRSRADVAVETRLSKATVSSLVAELVNRGLVREGALRQEGAIGRPARLLEVDGSRVGALGLEVNVDYIAAFGRDLGGQILVERRIAFDAMNATPDEALSRLAVITREALAEMTRRGAVAAGVTVAIPGLIDVARGHVLLAPNLGWREVPVAARLAAELDAGVPVRVDNDANLSALAEFREGSAAGTADLVYLTGEVGGGGGVIVGGRLLRGPDGFAGEVGHMSVDPTGIECGCGRRGCWETKVGLAALVRLATPDQGYATPGPVPDPEVRLAGILDLAAAGDQRTHLAFAEVGRWLGLGCSILVNLFNPHVLVLGGYFARVAEFVIPTAQAELDRLVIAGQAGMCRIEASTLGFEAAVRGGCGVAIEGVLEDPTSVPLVAVVSSETR